MNSNDQEQRFKEIHKTICIPYLKTGHCGFGDSCIYAHIRNEDLFNKNSSSLFYKCKLCNEPGVDKIITDCKHIFCFVCVSKYFKSSSKCFVCKKETFRRVFPFLD